MAKIIPFIASPGSGCTTLAAQLALHCAEQKETVSLVFADPVLPPKSYLLKEPKSTSLGFLLSFPNLSEKQILSAMDAATDSIGVIGYAAGDRLENFPIPSAAVCETLLKKLALCTDTVIVDLGSRLSDRLAAVALQLADCTVVCTDGTLKSAAWLATLQKKPDHSVTVANRLHSTLTANADILLPFFPDLMQQNEEMHSFSQYKEKNFQKAMQTLYSKTNVSKKTLSLVR